MYIIKIHYEATKDNPNFAGEIHDWYTGKGGEHLSAKDEFPTTYFIQNYGYKTLAAARRGLKAAKELADWETKKGYWIVTVEIIKVS